MYTHMHVYVMCVYRQTCMSANMCVYINTEIQESGNRNKPFETDMYVWTAEVTIYYAI